MEEKILFTSESVSEGHPDKLCDQISDAILDACLEQDPLSRVACECFTTTDFVLIGGEITTKAVVNYEEIARKVMLDIGYNNKEIGIDGRNCKILNLVQTQSPDIAPHDSTSPSSQDRQSPTHPAGYRSADLYSLNRAVRLQYYKKT